METIDDALDRFANRPQRKAEHRPASDDANPGLTVPFLVDMERAHRVAMALQRWAHANSMKPDEEGHRARAIHDWDTCPDCTFIDGGSRYGGKPFVLGPTGGKGTGPQMYERREAARQRRLAKKRESRRRKKDAEILAKVNRPRPVNKGKALRRPT